MLSSGCFVPYFLFFSPTLLEEGKVSYLNATPFFYKIQSQMKCELLLLLLKSAVAISCGRASSAGRDVSVNISAFTQTQTSAQ